MHIPNYESIKETIKNTVRQLNLDNLLKFIFKIYYSKLYEISLFNSAFFILEEHYESFKNLNLPQRYLEELEKSENGKIIWQNVYEEWTGYIKAIDEISYLIRDLSKQDKRKINGIDDLKFLTEKVIENRKSDLNTFKGKSFRNEIEKKQRLNHIIALKAWKRFKDSLAIRYATDIVDQVDTSERSDVIIQARAQCQMKFTSACEDIQPEDFDDELDDEFDYEYDDDINEDDINEDDELQTQLTRNNFNWFWIIPSSIIFFLIAFYKKN